MERPYQRSRYAFSRHTKLLALEKANYACEVTRTPASEAPLQTHHLLPIYVWYHHFRDIVPDFIIRSVDNAVVLREDVHELIHKQADMEHYKQVATWLLSINKQKSLV